MREPKRLLIISRFFFPQPVVGAVRMTQWCRFLPDFGWYPTVLCKYQGHLATPELLAEKLHPAVKVEYFNPPVQHGRPANSPASHWAQLWQSRYARSPLGFWEVPEVDIRFWRRVRAQTLQLVERLKPDAILTTSPPHSIHDLGMWLSEQTGIPWVADFRDPYTIDVRSRPRGLTKLRWSAHKDYERRIYEHAAMILHAIPIQARWARIVYPPARHRIVTLTNGCPVDLAEGKIDPAVSSNNRQSIRVIGSLSANEADKLAEAIKHLVDTGMNLELRHIGSPLASLPWMKKLVRAGMLLDLRQLHHQAKPQDSLRKKLGERFIATGALRHDEALRQVVGADVLVCSLSPSRSKALLLSSKLFEYLATGKPIIVINPTLPDRQFLRNFRGVCLLVEPDAEQVKTALQWALDPASRPPLEQTLRFKEEFNRRTQTAQLAGWLDKLTCHSQACAGEFK
jgi:glycosyltransferase involved in cell wall biosynthesis